MSVDPVTFMQSGNPSSFNRYAYVSNNPIKFLDPDGRYQFDPSSNNMVSTQGEILGAAHAAITKPAVDFFTEDAINAVSAIGRGDVKGAAGAAVLAFAKPVKVLDKALDRVKDVAEMAKDLSKQIGKNSVTIKTPNGAKQFDLDGASHRGVDTPHVQGLKDNTNPATGETFTNKVRDDVRPMTKADVRTVRKFIEKQKDK